MAGEGIKLTAKVTNKSKTNKGLQFEGQEGWFSVPEKLVTFAEKINKGDTVEVTYIKKGVFKNVVYLSATTTQVKTEEPKETPKTTTGFNCTVCGAELKDGKYKKCFNCNKKAKESPVEEKKEPVTTTGTKVFDEPVKEEKQKWTPGNYNNPEKTAQIQRGNALNAAAAVVSNSNIQLEDKSPEALAEVTKLIADLFLDWLRAE